MLSFLHCSSAFVQEDAGETLQPTYVQIRIVEERGVTSEATRCKKIGQCSSPFGAEVRLCKTKGDELLVVRSACHGVADGVIDFVQKKFVESEAKVGCLIIYRKLEEKSQKQGS